MDLLSLDDYELPLGMENIKKYHSFFFKELHTENAKGSVKKTLLYFTDFIYFFFEKKLFSNKLVLIDQVEFKDLAVVKYIDEPQKFLLLVLKTKRTITIYGKQAKNIALLLYSFSNSIFMDFEAGKLEFSFPKYTALPEIHHSIPLRIKYLLYLNNVTLSNSSIISLAKFFSSQPRELSLSQFRFLHGYMQLILNCIFWQKSITKIHVPLDIFPKGVEMITKMLKENNTIFELEFTNGKSSYFPVLFSTIPTNINCRIHTLSFNNVSLSASDLKALDNLIKEFPISHISINNALEFNKALMWTEKGIKNIPNYAYLQSLILDNTPGINLVPIFNKLTDLKYLSIVNSQIDIAYLVKLLQRPNSHIEHINASSNICKSRITYKYKMNPNTKQIDLTNMVWSAENLVSIWKFLSSSNVRIDLSCALLEKRKWSDFFEQVKRRKTNISMLFWDENPSDGLVPIIENSSELIGLSVRRCFGEGDPNVKALANFIRKTEKLKYLSIAGSRRKCLGNDTEHIIDALSENKSITRLDISRNRAGPANISKLGEILVKNQNIEVLSFEGNNIDTLSVFTTLFRNLAQREKPLLLTWPEKEINAIAMYDGTPQIEIDQLSELHRRISQGRK